MAKSAILLKEYLEGGIPAYCWRNEKQRWRGRTDTLQ